MYKNLKVAVLMFFLISGITFFIFLALGNQSLPVQEKKSSFVPPLSMQAVFLTNYSAASDKKIDEIIELSKKSEINSVVIDIKDWSGYIDYDAKIPQAELYQSKRILISDVSALIDKLHQNNIYAIARIVVFQDPILAKARPELAIHRYNKNGPLWLDNMGLAWLDPTSLEVWDYNIALAKDALSHGFDEVNFDYVRFASDGHLSSMVFPNWKNEIPRQQVISSFFKYLHQKMEGSVISVDLFGYTTVNKDDLGIGQIIEDAFPNFDFICPMTYPSLYNAGFIGLENPGASPYLVVKKSISTALARLMDFNQKNTPVKVKLRPWVQYFKGYNKLMVDEQIRAIKETTSDLYAGYIIWNPSNSYSGLITSN
jgi:hypothetical protein